MERELWKILYRLTVDLDKPWGDWRYATADVLVVYFWAVFHDRPTRWAADPKHYAGGTIDNVYEAGAVRNIATFHRQITEGNFANETVRMGVDSCLATILGREACLRKGRMTMEELLKANRKLEVDLTGLKT